MIQNRPKVDMLWKRAAAPQKLDSGRCDLADSTGQACKVPHEYGRCVMQLAFLMILFRSTDADGCSGGKSPMHTRGWALNSVHYQLKPANGWDRFGQTQAPSPMTNRILQERNHIHHRQARPRHCEWSCRNLNVHLHKRGKL